MQLITDVQGNNVKIYDLDDSGRAIAELTLPRHASYDHAIDVAEVVASKAQLSEPGAYNVWAEVYRATHIKRGVLRHKASVKRISFVAAGDAYANLCYGNHHEKLGEIVVPVQAPIAIQLPQTQEITA